MRVNKWVITGSMVIALVGALMIICFGHNTILESIGVSLLSGAIVSLVSASLYYAYEWQSVINSVKAVVLGLYSDLTIIKRQTGAVLPLVMKANLLADLNYRRITELASRAIELAGSSKVNEFSGPTKNSRTALDLNSFKGLVGEVSNLRSCIADVELLSLSADRYQYELLSKQTYGLQIMPFEQAALNEKRNLVSIRTAKVHEYEASLLLRVDELGKRIFHRKDESWNQVKKMVEQSTDELIAYADRLDSL